MASSAPSSRSPFSGRDSNSSGRGLDRPNKGAHEFAVHLRSDGIYIKSVAGEKLAGILDAVDARRFNRHRSKPGRFKLLTVLCLFECAGNAADPQEQALADFRQHPSTRHDVRDGEPAAGLEYAKGFGKHLVFVR